MGGQNLESHATLAARLFFFSVKFTIELLTFLWSVWHYTPESLSSFTFQIVPKNPFIFDHYFQNLWLCFWVVVVSNEVSSIIAHKNRLTDHFSDPPWHCMLLLSPSSSSRKKFGQYPRHAETTQLFSHDNAHRQRSCCYLVGSSTSWGQNKGVVHSVLASFQ